MTLDLISVSPRRTLEDNMRPADLLLRVYRLLNCDDRIETDGKMVDTLRTLVSASAEEDLMLIYNEIFLGLVREGAQVPRSVLRQGTLNHLLRQSVVASCTALETYLPALLRTNLPVMIRAKGRDFIPRGDNTVSDYFSDLNFTLDETLRLLSDENAAEYISNKILGLTKFSYLSSRKGVHVVCALLGIQKPWDAIADSLKRDKKELMSTMDDTVQRRNDIVHRADRSQKDPGGEVQEIGFAWTQHAVDTIKHICLAIDELVAEEVQVLQEMMLST